MNDSQRDELLIRIDERVNSIQEELKKGDNRFGCLERDVRDLKNFKYILVGIAVTISTVIGATVNYALSKLPK